jgi:hypothetical protein
MNAGLDQLTQSLIGKNSLHECSVAELQRLVIQYPYFSPAHLLLCQRLKSEDPALYEKQYQKTSLYFQNPLWLEYISANYVVNNTVSAAETGIENNTVSGNTVTEETVNESTQNLPAEETQTETEISQQLPETEAESVATPGETQAIAEEQEAPLPEIPSLKIEPVNESDQALTFEPYHTVDYFASQGIRFKEEEKPKDKFGQQLKSFTEWLKAMKRLPESEVVTPSLNTPSDPQVEKLAERSVSDGEVVTESMAEVWEKQGNKEKAIETYTKLSLLNPAKSSYFAAKIEHLKQL